jgi:hypothetical protein
MARNLDLRYVSIRVAQSAVIKAPGVGWRDHTEHPEAIALILQYRQPYLQNPLQIYVAQAKTYEGAFRLAGYDPTIGLWILAHNDELAPDLGYTDGDRRRILLAIFAYQLQKKDPS